MKDYIGIVVVKAEPLEKGGRPGYLIQLSDGTTYWASKENFEEAYRELDCELPEE